MATYTPYPDEVIVEAGETEDNYFGLIGGDGNDELHGYEITMDGRVVAPMLNPVGEQTAVRS